MAYQSSRLLRSSMKRSLRSSSSRERKASERGKMSKASGKRQPRSRNSRNDIVPDAQSQNVSSSTSRSPGRRGRVNGNAVVSTPSSSFAMPPSGGTRGRRPDFRSLSGKPFSRGNVNQHPPGQPPERVPRPSSGLPVDESEPESRAPGTVRKSRSSSTTSGEGPKVSRTGKPSSSKGKKKEKKMPEDGDSSVARSQVSDAFHRQRACFLLNFFVLRFSPLCRLQHTSDHL